MTQLLSCPIVPAGAAIHPDASAIADHAGPIILLFTAVFVVATARCEIAGPMLHALRRRA